MRRGFTIALLLVLGLAGVAHADQARDQSAELDEILRLVQEGVSDDVIVKHIEASGFVFDLSTDDILELRDLGVSDPVLEAMLDTAIEDDGTPRRATRYSRRSSWDSSAYFSLSAGYLSPWYWYPYAWGFYYDPFPAVYSFYYYPFHSGRHWGYYGYGNHYYYRHRWHRYRYDHPGYFAERRHQGDAVRVPRRTWPRSDVRQASQRQLHEGRRVIAPNPGPRPRTYDAGALDSGRRTLRRRVDTVAPRDFMPPRQGRSVDAPVRRTPSAPPPAVPPGRVELPRGRTISPPVQRPSGGAAPAPRQGQPAPSPGGGRTRSRP